MMVEQQPRGWMTDGQDTLPSARTTRTLTDLRLTLRKRTTGPHDGQHTSRTSMSRGGPAVEMQTWTLVHRHLRWSAGQQRATI